VVAALNKDFYPIRVDTDKEPLVAGMFGVKGLPYNLFLTENGKILAHRPGYVPPATFLKILYSVNGIEVSQ
jgi:thioredoxin-related protein